MSCELVICMYTYVQHTYINLLINLYIIYSIITVRLYKLYIFIQSLCVRYYRVPTKCVTRYIHVYMYKN